MLCIPGLPCFDVLHAQAAKVDGVAGPALVLAAGRGVVKGQVLNRAIVVGVVLWFSLPQSLLRLRPRGSSPIRSSSSISEAPEDISTSDIPVRSWS
jgi:hypothetical protein